MSTDETKSSKGQQNLERQQVDSMPISNFLTQQIEELKEPNPKFSSRYSRKSLENTNVRTTEETDGYVPSGQSNISLSQSPSGRYLPAPYLDDGAVNDNKENQKGKPSRHNYRKDVELSPSALFKNGLDHSEESSSQLGSGNSSARNNEIQGESSAGKLNAVSDKQLNSTSNDSSNFQRADEVDRSIVRETRKAKPGNAQDIREFECEKNVPWLRIDPTNKNLSKQMFLYLTHKELKCKIEDLAKREMHACTKQSWDEALRLRDMRNRMEIIREKRLYNTDDLELDEDVKKLGMENINQREEKLAQRELACMDSTMYSEEAKALWKKWVNEDEKCMIKDARLQRETLMNNLEKEWQNLALRDKERISRSYEKVMTDSSLQDEHKLAASGYSASTFKALPHLMK